MRPFPIILALSVAAPAVALAQPVDQTPAPAEQAIEEATPQPVDGAAVPPVTVLDASQAKPGAVPGPDGVIRQWGPQQPITQSAPPPAQSYPPCTKGRSDACTNPDPRKEADVRRDGTIGGVG